ncbi:MAG: hypothetical protein GYB36_02280 [Alphaproteobacteria bacterium]|nr:hypothetical protein [Alphaproteobacteria bacterium]
MSTSPLMRGSLPYDRHCSCLSASRPDPLRLPQASNAQEVDDAVRSLGFGQEGHLDALALDILAARPG